MATLALAGVVAGATPWVGATTKATDCMAQEEEGRRASLVLDLNLFAADEMPGWRARRHEIMMSGVPNILMNPYLEMHFWAR